jgi:hypothetical protein
MIPSYLYREHACGDRELVSRVVQTKRNLEVLLLRLFAKLYGIWLLSPMSHVT